MGGNMESLKKWFKKTFPDEPLPRAERRNVPGLEAFHWTGTSPGLDNVKDISSSGIYVQTNERWPPGEINPIRLTCEDLPVEAPGHDVELQAKSVRWGEDGMGLAFVLPKSMELWLWRTDKHIDPADIVNEFRIAKALAFLCRICPAATQELKLFFREGLSNIRVTNVIQIALRAEQMLAREFNADKMSIPKDTLMHMVEKGSWAEDDLTQQLWTGLLVTSCTNDGSEEPNSEYVEILSELSTILTRIYHAACTRTTKTISDSGTVTAEPVICTEHELVEIAGAHDLLKIDRNLTLLFDLGLIGPRLKSKFFSYNEDVILVPTELGLAMYARCQGHRGAPHDFYRGSLPISAVEWNKKHRHP